MNTVISLIIVVASLFTLAVSLSPDYYHNVSFLDGVENVTDVDFGNISLYDDDEEEEEEEQDEKQHQEESEEYDRNQ